jgi:hypothetical protein
MTVQDRDVNIKFMQSVELLYLNDDGAFDEDSVSARDLFGPIARYLRLSIQLDEEYSGKGIDVYVGEEATLQESREITYSYDEASHSYAVKWGDKAFCIDGDSIPTASMIASNGEKTIRNGSLQPDLVIYKKGSNLENVAIAEIQKNADLHSQDDLEKVTQSMIKLCCYTRDETELSGMFATGIYFGLHRDYCYVFIFRNGKLEHPCYRYEEKTGIWKKQQPEQAIAVCQV